MFKEVKNMKKKLTPAQTKLIARINNPVKSFANREASRTGCAWHDDVLDLETGRVRIAAQWSGHNIKGTVAAVERMGLIDVFRNVCEHSGDVNYYWIKLTDQEA